MSIAQSASFWATTGLYVVATIVLVAGAVWKRRPLMTWGLRATWVGLAAHAVAVGVRWAEAGHFPYIEDYENVLVGTFVMVLAYLLVAWRWKGLESIGLLVMPVVLVTLGYGLTQGTESSPVTPVYQSAWLVVHVTFAWFTYAAYSAVAGMGLALLWRQRAEKRGREATGVPSWMPPSSRIDDLSLPLVSFGFLMNAVMIASGSIWAFRLWGSYWRWDPVETWSLLTWLAYGFYLHARLTLGWRGKRLAWVALFALFGVLMTFWGVQLAPTSYHLFRDLGGTLIEMSRPQ